MCVVQEVEGVVLREHIPDVWVCGVTPEGCDVCALGLQ